ncbi:nitroreductase family deazaflavin-dependent oxidoreductase [Nocardioides panzhihuensis]|uniref:Deazaflavin-dependent oxidoreductase (Nitroreductase family) n=1 Tax=Nocardioides panzhihuensis TaxID=860243 RepID=A0A7Z0DQJ7_9ACTN|nr:nitroreductase family deazaflavin-dependent oxidoreductase [Nocardioides panzhihuensis]NYI79868.1 deazaflavin-dependent oxidoreductase (nitroreductase family) [Nocardioides panzhihuensis]
MTELQGEYVPSTADWVREQVAAFEASGGAEANVLERDGKPIILITNRGAKTGAIRKTPLMRVERDGRYLAVASMGGSDKNPAWVANFRKYPDMALQDGGTKKAYVARELAGEEREEWWAYAVQTWPTYGDYQPNTSRVFPLFLLEPADEQPAS